MTEWEWLACADPRAMCEFVRTATVPVRTRWQGWQQARRFRVSDRKLRLVEVACCARIAHLLPFPHLGGIIPLAERHAEGLIGSTELAGIMASLSIRMTASGPPRGILAPGSLAASIALGRLLATASDVVDLFEHAARAWAEESAAKVPANRNEGILQAELACERRRQAEIVRDVIGNPFQTYVIEPAWKTSNDDAVGRIAEMIYESRRYQELPVLADALEDAGCTEADVLDHCRRPANHHLGCWVVDVVLDKG